MRLLVCGGRNFRDTKHAYATLDMLHRTYRVDVLIEGDARGADRIAGYWARRNRIDNLKFPADWKAYGLAAGTIRNGKMLADGKPDLVLAFPGGRGTADMVRRARAAGVPIHHEVLAGASGMEAATAGETTEIGSTEGDSPTGEAGDAQALVSIPIARGP